MYLRLMIAGNTLSLKLPYRIISNPPWHK
uniref:Uncharacterized protein n=1 Tax=Pyricularia oryzae (strain P131) TaxID=1143193 RepID=L7IWV4_PYRO1